LRSPSHENETKELAEEIKYNVLLFVCFLSRVFCLRNNYWSHFNKARPRVRKRRGGETLLGRENPSSEVEVPQVGKKE
jgi:hypothetical protein